MRSSTVVLVLTFITASLAAKTKLSSLVSLCSKSDSNINDCLKKAGEQILPHLVKGIRDFGFPPIDPLKIPFMELSQSDRPVGLKLNITDSTHTGMKELKLTDAKINKDTKQITYTLYFPKYEINGHCDVGGRILLLPISGSGPCFLSSNEMTGPLVIDYKVETKNGKEVFSVAKATMTIKFGKGAFHLEGLFGGNKELGATMNRFLNENAVEVLNEMKGTLESVWSDLFQGLVSRIFNSVPIDEVFSA